MAEAGENFDYTDATGWMPILGPMLQSIKQKSLAKKINPVRPDYKRPGEIDQNVNMWNPMANSSKMPGQSIMEDNVHSNTANGFNMAANAANGSAQLLSTLGKLNVNENNAINDLNVQGANNRTQAMGELGKARESLAQYKDQEFDYNKNQPYELALMRKRALQGAALANKDTAKQDTHNVASSVLAVYGCFDGDALVKMDDGTEKKISELKIGDRTAGGEILAKQEFKAGPLLDYKGVLVTYFHAVCENGTWLRAGQSRHALGTGIVAPLYNLTTSNHRIFVNDIEFADYAELDIQEHMAIYEYSLDVLNGIIV
jgi:hypothetical protein